MRVVEGGGDPRLAEEALAEALVLRQLRGDHLERDLAPPAFLGGAVNRTHPPAADELLDPVARDGRPRAELGACQMAHRRLLTAAARGV